MKRLACLAAALLLAGAIAAQEEKKAKDEKTPELKPLPREPGGALPKLKFQEPRTLQPGSGPLEDGKENLHETYEKQGWVYLLDSRVPKGPSWDLMGLWRPRDADPGRNLWSIAEEGGERVFCNKVEGPNAHGTDLISKQSFYDFDLHAEFRVPEGSNSGIYLRGRYEIQINGFPADKSKNPGANDLGALYNVRQPDHNASKGPGQWQTIDVSIRGTRIVNLRLNGEVIHLNVQLPPEKLAGTGSQLTSKDGVTDDPSSPGPIFLQGDHGSVDFRNVRVRPNRAAVRMLPAGKPVPRVEIRPGGGEEKKVKGDEIK